MAINYDAEIKRRGLSTPVKREEKKEEKKPGLLSRFVSSIKSGIQSIQKEGEAKNAQFYGAKTPEEQTARENRFGMRGNEAMQKQNLADVQYANRKLTYDEILAKRTREEQMAERDAKFLTAPIRYTAGSLASGLVSLGLEKANSDLQYTPKTDIEKLLIGDQKIQRITKDESLYGVLARGAGTTTAVIAMAALENPFLNGTGVSTGIKNVLKRKLEKEGAEYLAKLGSKEFIKLADEAIKVEKANGKITKIEAEQALKTVKEEVAKKTPLKPKVVKEDPLIQEARKYKSADEFVKAQGTPYYHGTSDVNASAIEQGGFKAGKSEYGPGQFKQSDVYLTTNKADAQVFANAVAERTGGKPVVIEAYSKDAKLGPDKVDYTVRHGKESNIKTKSQLTDIYNQAKGVSKELKVKVPKTNTSYKIQHQITNGTSASNLINLEDIVKQHKVNNGYLTKYDLADLGKLKKLQGNPNQEVTIYRASPLNELNNGDWVTTSKTYANDIKKQNGGKVYEYTVKAGDLIYPNDITELPSLARFSAFKYEPNQVAKGVSKNANPSAKTYYHGTDAKFDNFDFSLTGKTSGEGKLHGLEGSWFVDNKDVAKGYGKNLKGVSLDTTDFLTVDAKGKSINDFRDELWDAKKLVKDGGKKGLVVKNLVDNADYSKSTIGDHVFVVDKSAIKPAAKGVKEAPLVSKKQPIVLKPVDEMGNVIKKEGNKKVTVEPLIANPSVPKRIENQTIEKGLVDNFKNIDEYDKVSFKDQAVKVGEIIDEDPERAIRIALGKELPTNGALPESVFIAVKNQALAKGDTDLLIKLATEEGGVAKESTLLGQRIKMLDERLEDDAFRNIKRVIDNRREFVKDKVAKEVSSIKSSVKKSMPKKDEWLTFVDEITC